MHSTSTEPQALLIGSSATLRGLEEEIDCAARSDAKVLITGESGVGKEVVARMIHQRSRRGRLPLVTINCAGVPDGLLETELFGHVRGSFTDAHRDRLGWLEQAHSGTVFLDEIGEMSLRMQALLLRFLENGEIQRVGSDRRHSVVDVRVIAATNRDLLGRVADKVFREDLYYRLNVIHLPIPSLRERKADISTLFACFVRSYSATHRIEEPKVAEGVIARLTAYGWPGNVRELKNVAERLVIRSRGVIGVADLPGEIAGSRSAPAVSQEDVRPVAATTAALLYQRMVTDGRIVLDRRVRAVHVARSDPHRSAGRRQDGPRADARQLQTPRPALQPSAGRLQADPQLPPQARVPHAVSEVPLCRGACGATPAGPRKNRWCRHSLLTPDSQRRNIFSLTVLS